MTESTEQQPPEHDFGPGALLKQTRQQKDLSLEEVSTRLKLTLPVLKKIEADDYEGDLPVTFYRGYLKNYAELLELDDVDICANFRDFCTRNNLFSAAPPKLQGLELDKPMGSTNWLFKAVTTLIILALLFAIYYVTVEKELWKKFVPDSTEQQSESIDGLPIGSQGASQLDIQEPAVSNDEELPLGNINTEQGDVNPSTNTEGELKLGEGDDTGAENDNGTDNGATFSQNDVSQPPQPSSDVVTQAVTGSGLTLSFSGDCWVRIQDATGKVLALGIKSAGTNLRLSGQAPYNLTLGKASAVQLTFNGDAVDLSGYSDERAAKLTLGDNS